MKCSEKGCPFPVAAGQALCTYHEEMFASEDEVQFEPDFSQRRNGKPLTPEASSIVFGGLTVENRISRWKQGVEREKERLDFEKLKAVVFETRRRKRLIESGLCVSCGSSPPSRGRVCSQCRKRNRDYQNAKVARRKVDGICVLCGRMRIEPGNALYCRFCWPRMKEYNARSGRRVAQRRREAGQCQRCGRNSAPYLCCLKCRNGATHARKNRLGRGLCARCSRERPVPNRLCCKTCQTLLHNYFARKYRQFKKQRICPICKNDRLARGHAACRKCLSKKRCYLRSYKQRQRQRWRAAGLCGSCGKFKPESGKVCVTCRQRLRESSRQKVAGEQVSAARGGGLEATK
jgi:hypothetical protein